MIPGLLVQLSLLACVPPPPPAGGAAGDSAAPASDDGAADSEPGDSAPPEDSRPTDSGAGSDTDGAAVDTADSGTGGDTAAPAPATFGEVYGWVAVSAKADGNFGDDGCPGNTDVSTALARAHTFAADGEAVVIEAGGSINHYSDDTVTLPDGTAEWADGYYPLEEAWYESGGERGLDPEAVAVAAGALFGVFVDQDTLEAEDFSAFDEDVGGSIPAAGLFFIGEGPYTFTAPGPGALDLGINNTCAYGMNDEYTVALSETGADVAIVAGVRNGHFGEPWDDDAGPMRPVFTFTAKGEAITLQAEGEIENMPGVWKDADGWTRSGVGASEVFPLDQVLAESGEYLDTTRADVAALIGAFVPAEVEASEDFEPTYDELGGGIAAGDLFLLGKGPQLFTAPGPGTLYLAVNDSSTTQNSGAFRITLAPWE